MKISISFTTFADDVEYIFFHKGNVQKSYFIRPCLLKLLKVYLMFHSRWSHRSLTLDRDWFHFVIWIKLIPITVGSKLEGRASPKRCSLAMLEPLKTFLHHLTAMKSTVLSMYKSKVLKVGLGCLFFFSWLRISQKKKKGIKQW